MRKGKVLAFGLAMGCLVVFLFGCAEKKSEPQTQEARKPGVVEYMTGAAEAKTYQKTRSKIEDISNARKEQYQEMDQQN